MIAAEDAVQKVAAHIPAEVRARFGSDKLSDEDRKAVIDIARRALTSFQPKPEPKAVLKPEPASNVKPKVKGPPTKAAPVRRLQSGPPV